MGASESSHIMAKLDYLSLFIQTFFHAILSPTFSNKCAAINEWPVAIWTNKKFRLFSKRNDVLAREERGKFIAHKVLAQLTLEYSPLLNFVYRLVQSSKPVVAHCHQQECFRIQFSAQILIHFCVMKNIGLRSSVGIVPMLT